LSAEEGEELRRIKLSIIMALLFSSLFMFASTVQLVKAPATTIYIMADGSINPSTANITTSNRITYTFTRNNYLPIVVQRSNIIIDGRGYTLQASVNVNGFSLSDVNNVTIRKTTITNCFNSVYLLRSSGNTISENKIISNRLMGIFLYGSSNNIISGNNITANDSGILLGWGSSGNTISKNNVTLNYNNGIWLYSYSDRNTISYNNVNYNSIHNQAYNSGIMVEGFSSRNMITGNEVHYNPRKEIELYGGAFYNTIIGNNVSDGSDLIEIWLASGNTAIGNNVTRAMWNGFVIAHTSNITLIGNRATAVGFGNRVWPGGAYGIAMENCSNCRVSGNYASANSGDGIYFGSTTGSTIVGNTIEQNGYSGIEFDNSYRRASSNNNITSNRIADNNASIRFVDADNNVIYHNDFINNQNKPQIDSASTGNAWNVAYPSGGNYWSDYTGVDQKSGPNQNLPGSDGIGDTPYVVNGSNRDNYPLMSVYNKLGLSASVSPSSATLDVGQSQLFTSTVSGGTSPYTYQWYLNNVAVSGGTSSTWTFTPASSGSYTIYVNVTDSVGFRAKSKIASVTVNYALSASILPSSATLNVGQSQLFTSSVSGGTSPFGYQWYVNGATVPGETSSTYTYTSSAAGSFSVYVRVTDSASVPATAQSNTATVTVNSLTTVLFSDGFESGNFGAWRYVFGTPSIVTSPVYSGTYAAYAATSGNGAVAVLSSAQTSAYVQSRFYITPQATAWTVMDILRLSDTTWSNTISNIQLIHNTGNQYSWALSGSNNGIIETVSQPFTLTTATWVTIRVETYIDASTGYYKLYVNDVLTLTLTGKDTNNFGGVQSVYCGALWSNSPWVLGWDDFSIGLAS
jgi:parallel beta-helix repeat protein